MIKIVVIDLVFLFLININLFAQINVKTKGGLDAEFEHDIIRATEQPGESERLADGWYEIGEKEAALAFDEIFLSVCFEPFDIVCLKERNDKLANKWYGRGEKEVALEFDKTFLNNPMILDRYWWTIAENENAMVQKWYEWGEMEAALALDEFFLINIVPNLKGYPNNNQAEQELKMINKWYDLGELDMAREFVVLGLGGKKREISNMRNGEFFKVNPYMIEKWYRLGEKEMALELSQGLLSNCSSINENCNSSIADMWYQWGEEKAALELDKSFLNNPGSIPVKDSYDRTAIIRLENAIAQKWHERGKKEAELEIDDFFLTDVIPNRRDIEVSSRILRDNIINKWSERGEVTIADHFSVDPNKIAFHSLKPIIKKLSIVDYLAHRTYISQKYLDSQDISIERARMMLEVDLYELAKKSDILFSILHVIALHAKEDPRYKLDIFHKEVDKFGQELEGNYSPMTGQVTIVNPSLRSSAARSFLAHEWTHQMMVVLFHNFGARPYADNDEAAKNAWKKVMKEVYVPSLRKNFGQSPYEKTRQTFGEIYSDYGEYFWDGEVIARFSQQIASGDYDDPAVQKFLEPIYNYWMKYIEPAIEKYIREHAAIDDFVSDRERELIEDPFYRQILKE